MDRAMVSKGHPLLSHRAAIIWTFLIDLSGFSGWREVCTSSTKYSYVRERLNIPLLESEI